MARQSSPFGKMMFGAAESSAWTPAADIYRLADGWLVKFDLAGVRPEDVTITLQGTQLILRGVRRDWFVETGCQQYCMEIAYSHFERVLTLPSCLDQLHIQTEFRHGMFLIRLFTEGTTP
ncbi:Hsp20/alpha crystallin family protein [Tuwongella immobilis]|uniref:SHSP domain-containing protein n=1 Tax=Tuwongella immobilis TaxID=692036 RepID=A0A6C2YMK7_9BACT|nr:Hsp20/alpha crystallin family protein [Tuwongella immobilis]VIP02305.1 Heat shock protein Hsp20 OS=Nitrosococcus halophilus (strain Nc4) GN=Nhal_1380 PE=3 SV=1: HSP20 [Tuwongella immobilis]VTS01001.1 Heat shock protein Hsp20 OS=Nitrosococcus halophilus (strain Nc4) GN=Nhal_1380 PE=3 SV=1: HSP20 [Tuwongella immobilis]